MNPTNANQPDFPKSFEDARQNTLVCGFLLACHQTLLNALRDRRLQQKHRGVLAVLIEHMNRKSGMAWPGRDLIGAELGIAPKTVSNALRDLTMWGYIMAENRRTAETANRSLRHYTLAGLSRAELERHLADAIDAIKRRGPKLVTPDAAPSKVTARSGFESHRPQCLSVDLGNRKSPPAVDESHRPPWTVTNKEELVEKNKGEGPFVIAAHACEVRPLPQSRSVSIVGNGSQLIADQRGVAAMFEYLDIANPSKAQRDKVSDTLTKAALQWEAKGCRDRRYLTASDWFVGSWLPGLRDDLEKLADTTTPKRFKSELEKQIVFGTDEKKHSLTRAGINSQLDEADKILGGAHVSIVDFDAVKSAVTSDGSLGWAMAKAAMVRIYGRTALSFSESELRRLSEVLGVEGFPVDDVTIAVSVFSTITNLDGACRYYEYRVLCEAFDFSARRVLLDRTNYFEKSLDYIRAALPVIAADRAKQYGRWQHREANGYNRGDETVFRYSPSNDLKFPAPTFVGELVLR